MNRILIEVRGGVVQEVYATPKVEVAIVDWDNVEGARVGMWQSADESDIPEETAATIAKEVQP